MRWQIYSAGENQKCIGTELASGDEETFDDCASACIAHTDCTAIQLVNGTIPAKCVLFQSCYSLESSSESSFIYYMAEGASSNNSVWIIFLYTFVII